MSGFSDNIFTRFLYEAPDDDPPDVVSDTGPPPDVPDDIGTDDGPPDMGDSFGDDTSGSMDSTEDDPPDMGDGFDDDSFGGDMGDDTNESNSEGNNENLELDDKVSAVMNETLYHHYMSLLTSINSQLTSIRDNSDILYTLSEDTINVVKILEELDENVRLYIKNKFLNENYSKNRLFYNKCLNLLKLLNEVFDNVIHKGIKEQK